ncbi:MAG TPA: 5-oxoprolinase subunit PxpB [Thermoanaerobaculia bacterium]|nr:5-oxoprolinase subunit PxpB [Thermoanaerobaculia bacterium]
MRDGALLVEFPEASDEEGSRAAAALGKHFATAPPAGLLDAIAGARTVLVVFDPERLGGNRLRDEIARGVPGVDGAGETPRLIRLPVAYGGAAALDLAALARDAALSEEELVRRHAGAEYRVAFVGFAPGFAYLAGLPSQLQAPRLPSPRPRVPAGAVAIGGPYTGVYPAAMPGGWRLIGRSPARLFDPEAARPSLLSPGDRVRFDRVREEELPAPAPPVRERPPGGRPVFRVESSGVFSGVLGAPRYGLGSSGVPAGGAMDLRSLAHANALLGNDAGAAALEAALVGPELAALEDVEVAVAGADFEVEVDGKPAPLGRPIRIPPGSRLRFGRARRGARAYLAVAGGFVDARLPGEAVRRVERGEVLAARTDPPSRGGVSPPAERPPGDPIVLRVVPGPQVDHFPAATLERFLESPWRVSPVSDRRGVRLDGERLEHALAAEIPPEGTVYGSIQVPGDGLPIVLGPDGPVTGGYPKIGTVIAADLPILGQAAPGDALRFRAVTVDDARRARQEYD